MSSSRRSTESPGSDGILQGATGHSVSAVVARAGSCSCLREGHTVALLWERLGLIVIDGDKVTPSLEQIRSKLVDHIRAGTLQSGYRPGARVRGHAHTGMKL